VTLAMRSLGQTRHPATAWPEPVSTYHRSVVSPTRTEDTSERETQAVESDPDLYRRVLRRMTSASFVDLDSALSNRV
jgi:hypothetical protein